MQDAAHAISEQLLVVPLLVSVPQHTPSPQSALLEQCTGVPEHVLLADWQVAEGKPNGKLVVTTQQT